MRLDFLGGVLAPVTAAADSNTWEATIPAEESMS